MSGRVSRPALRAIHEFRARLTRYKLQERRLAREALADDPAITAAVQAHMAEHGMSEQAVRRQVRKYLDEIIPHFNVLSYYRVGYNLAKITCCTRRASTMDGRYSSTTPTRSPI